jgi:hypothetical protein
MGNNPKTLDNEFMIIMYLFKKKEWVKMIIYMNIVTLIHGLAMMD